MKKIIIITASLCIAATSSFGQISIDPEIGVNSATLFRKVGNTTVTNKYRGGFNAGIGFQIPIIGGLYFKPGLQYTIVGDMDEQMITSTTTTMHYLRVPMNLGYRLQLPGNAGAFFAETGPYLGFAMGGTVKVDNIPIIGSTETDINFGSENNEIKPVDIGMNFGAGYESPWKLYVKINYGLGLQNLSNSDNSELKNSVWNFNLGYRIMIN